MQNKNTIITNVLCQTSKDPWYNLAVEEQLLKQVKENQVILYLWQNENTVVIGNNQNPWKEVKCKELEQDNGKLARRLSGGGAVYHDLGNLNFTFIMGKRLYDLEKQLSVILQSVKQLGIDAEFSGRNDLVVEGKKFSGNAFYYGRYSSYHHGTLLIDVDMSKLQKYLNVSFEKISSKGIDSVKSRVVNLHDLNNEITIDRTIESLINNFNTIYNNGNESENILFDSNSNELEQLYNKYSSWDWRYGQTPKFDVEFNKRFGWGNIQMGLKLKNASIISSQIYSDAMNSNLIKEIAREIESASFNRECIINSIDQVNTSKEEVVIKEDILKWIAELDI